MRPVLALAAVAALALTVSPAVEAKPPSSQISFPADFELTYCPDSTTVNPSCAWMESALYADGTWEHFALHIPGLGVLPYTLWGDWELQRGGKRLVIVLDDSFSTTYVGDKVSANCWAGTYSAATNPPTGGAWEGCIVP